MSTPAQPFWFGDVACPLFGWYHAAQAPQRTCGVVLCAPFGHEYLVAYRAYRKLAERLAAAGFPVCFFDYDGCGDSADSDGPRLAAWQRSTTLAMAALKQHSGVAKIALFGVRLGALLAASVAAAANATATETEPTEPVAALLMVAPVVAGRGYVRELLAFARMSSVAASSDPARAVNDDEITGYAFDANTQADLSQLDLLKLVPVLPLPIFLNGRDDVTGTERKLVDALTLQETNFTLCTVGGYAAMMTSDAHSAQVPEALWDALVKWMCEKFTIQSVATSTTPSSATDAFDLRTRLFAAGKALDEELVCFQGLSGVLTEPTVPASEIRATAVVLTNIGASHRVGNHRLYVNLARTLASNGFRVLRFDRSGIGYSRATPKGQENEVYAQAGISDVHAAMDFLQTYRSMTGFVLGGLCSGAYFSYHAAVLDPRAVGLVMMNPLTFQWHDGDVLSDRIQKTIKSTDFYWRALTDGATWKRALTGDIALQNIAVQLAVRLKKRLHGLIQRLVSSLGLATPKLSPVARNFLRMQERGTKFLFVFGADDAAIDVVSAELGPQASVLGDSAQFGMKIVSHTDHTFTPRWSQQYVQNYFVEYLKQKFR